jgi:AmmeMemoRadiSam system protein A
MLLIRDEEKEFALRESRLALIEFLEHGLAPSCQTDAPGLLQQRGTFVTLRRRDTGQLRGCRGDCRAVRPLIESVIEHTISAATDDPRFPAVVREEVSDLTIRISALTTLVPVRAEEIILGRHGLLLVKGRRSGLLLPEVAAHFGLSTADEFLDALFRKARTPRAEPWKNQVELYSFETDGWGDEDQPSTGSP